MKKEEMLKNTFIDMNSEFYVNHRKICREITSVFNNEIMHFKQLLLAFNDEHNCLEADQIDSVVQKVKEIFNNSKVMLVEDYDIRFVRNVDDLTRSMYDFFVKKLNNKNAKNPSREINEKLKDMCKFDCFLIEDKLEDTLIDFAGDFGYRYINSEDAHEDFNRIIRSIKYSLMCDLKKAIASSIDDKENITSRYNTIYKEILNPERLAR
jgi:flagellin-specific chaperone FliS